MTDSAKRGKEGRISVSDPAAWPTGWRIKPRVEGGIRLDFRLTARGVLISSVLILVGAVILGLEFLGAAAGRERLPFALVPTAISLAAVWLVWSLRTRLFPSRWLVSRDRLDVLRGFLHPKLVASFGAGPIDVVRTVNDSGNGAFLVVQIPAPFVGEPFVLFEGSDTDAVWLARLLAQETGWQLFVTPDAGRPDLSNRLA